MTNRIGQQAVQILAVNGVRTTLATTAGQYKWHPGFYPFFGTYNPTPTQLRSFLTSPTTGLAGLSSEVKGVLIPVTAGRLEVVMNDFSAGNDYLLSLYDECKPRGFRMALYVTDTRFGSASNLSSAGWYYIPPYYATLPNGGGGIQTVGQTNGSGVIAKRYNPAIMDRMIALAANIGSLFNNASHFEWFATIPETEMSVNSSVDSAYSDTGYLNQLERYAVALKSSFSRTIVTFGPNSQFGQTDDQAWGRLFAFMESNRVGRSPPDQRPSDYPPVKTDPTTFGLIADKYYYGIRGGINYVGRIPCLSRWEEPDYAKYGKPYANHPTHKGASGFWYVDVTYLKASHAAPANMDYVYGESKGALGVDQVKWSNATMQPDERFRVRPMLAVGGRPMTQTPPSCYPSVDTG